MHLRTKILALSTLPLLLLVLIGINRSSAQNPKQVKRVGLTVLQSSETLIESDFSKRPVLTPSKDGQRLYTLDTVTGDVLVYDKKSKRQRKISDSSTNAEAFTVGPQGDIYLAHLDSTVQIVNSQGRRLDKFPTVYPRSIAVLGNGNLVIASPSNGKLLHLYSNRGALLTSFGDLKFFDNDVVENEFLNRGKVIVGPGDQIYYISTYAPEPYVSKFSSEGQLFAEFQVEGDAIDFQTDLTKDFLRRRRMDESGGITIINSASISADTGHLWLGLNGLSTQGTIYEYDETGSKVREYALILNSDNRKLNITHVKDIAISSDAVDVLTWGGTYSFRFRDILVEDASAVPRKDSGIDKPTWRQWANPFARIRNFWAASPVPVTAIPQTPCAEAQSYACTANCPAGSNPQSVDCGAESASLLGDRIAIQSVCTARPINATPGIANPGGCDQTVSFCNSTTGATGDFTVHKNCNAVPTPTPTPTPEPTPTPTPQPTPTPGYCLGIQDLFNFPSSGCVTGLFFQGPCTRSAAFRSRCEGYVEEDCNCDGGGYMSPIVIDVDRSGFSMTDAPGGVAFDMLNDGVPLQLSWTAAGSSNAFLVLDRNNNGTIDTGEELFGDVTPQPPSAKPNGFLALAEYDKSSNGGNGNGRIDNSDAIFSQLRLWQDANHNGVSEATELHTLGALGIAGIDLKYKESKKTDAFGNQFRYRAKVYDARGVHSGRWAWDVFLTVQ